MTLSRTKIYIFGFITLLLLTLPVFAQAQNSDRAMRKLVRSNFELAAKQYKLLGAQTPAAVMPRSYIAAEKNSLPVIPAGGPVASSPARFGIFMKLPAIRLSVPKLSVA